MPLRIDTTFDFRTDTPPGRDPDALSPTLHRYHQTLWSKPLPGGQLFTLEDARPRRYLRYQGEAGDFFLSSDAVVPSFRKQRSLGPAFAAIPAADRDAFLRLGYTIGGMMLFPGNVIDRKMTINAARGCHPRIKDRFDLTIECIRRHYLGQPSPLQDVLLRYNAFFSLFGDFRRYIDFFLLQDIVTSDYTGVVFHAPFADFSESPVPKDLPAYVAYRERASAFLADRNRRILEYAQAYIS